MRVARCAVRTYRARLLPAGRLLITTERPLMRATSESAAICTAWTLPFGAPLLSESTLPPCGYLLLPAISA